MAERNGQSYIIDWLRDNCAMGTADYTFNGGTYWTDTQIAAMLDTNKRIIKGVSASYIVENIGGTSRYYTYQLPFTYFEDETSGTGYFRLWDSYGNLIGTADYSLDPVGGYIYFTDDREGSAVYADLTLYNINKTAGEIWRRKAAHIAEHSYDVKLEGHTLSRSQRMRMYLDAANYYAKSGGFNSVPVIRADVTGM